MKEAKVLFSNDVLLGEAGIMKLDYCLLENYSEEWQGSYYGVRITKYMDGVTESDEVPGISTSKEKVVSILKKLYEHQVTPITLVEILDDMESMEEFNVQSEMIMQEA